MDALSKAASEALGKTIELEAASGGGYSGGGGASTSAVKDKRGRGSLLNLPVEQGICCEQSIWE